MKFVCCLSKTFKKYGILKVQRNLLFHTEFKISIHPKRQGAQNRRAKLGKKNNGIDETYQQIKYPYF